MPTTYTDQFYEIDPASPPVSGTTISPVTLNLVDKNNNGTITRNGNNGDSLDGVDITGVYPGDVIEVIRNGVTVTITGTTFYLADGRVFFTPTDGEVLQTSAFGSTVSLAGSGAMPVSALGPPCFTPGTLIRVPGGEVPVEDLKAGDLVETMDGAAQVLRWVGRRQVNGTGDFAPVAIAPGVLGNHRELLVSPDHRMLLTGWWAELNFGEDEVLIAARHLLTVPGIDQRPVPRIDYLHLLFDRHEVIFAEGAPSESFHPDSWLLDGDRALRAEIAAVFPNIFLFDRSTRIPPARRVVTGREARLMAA